MLVYSPLIFFLLSPLAVLVVSEAASGELLR
jgi:hypothetical protein